ncbi:MAG: hypothetical protein ACRC2H_11455 [Silanimonas sp.]
MNTELLVVRQWMAVVLWALAAVWCCGLVVGTVVLGVNGPPEGAVPFWAWLVLIVFWSIGAGLAAVVFGQPAITLRIWPDRRAELVRQWPLKRDVLALQANELRLQLAEGTDADGDPYFRLRLSAAPHLAVPVNVAEGRREDCEAVRDRLLAAGVAMAQEPDEDGDPAVRSE